MPTHVFRQIMSPLATGLLTLGLLVPVQGGAAVTPEQKCQDAIAIKGRNYFKSLYKAISRCEGKKTSGVIGAGVNCRPAEGPVTDAKTDASLTSARDKLVTVLQKKCGAVVVADVEVGLPCNAETTAADLIDCVADQAYGPLADSLIETAYNAAANAVPLPNKDSQKCQKAIGKEAVNYASARMTQRRSCAKKFVQGKIDGTCPDTKTDAKLEKFRSKLSSKVLKKCGAAQLTDPNLPLDFGFPCDSYELTSFDRSGISNAIPIEQRMAGCITAASAGIGDMGAETAYPLPDAAPFSYGVAAGDATDSSFVAWSRTVNTDPVTLEVATDPGFAALAFSTVLIPAAAADNTVKTDVTGLNAATQYYYRFTQGADTSRSGRIRTAPSAGGPITFAFTGDSNAFFKPYDVLEQITKADPDLWLYIGDTIYGDDPRSGSGVALVRSDYHAKYRENREDRALRDLMAAVGTVTIWDDHEVTNDFFGTDPNIQAQMAEGSQAFRDYMPLREDPNDAMQLYRAFHWGDVADFLLIDDRQYRDAQADLTEPTCLDAGEPVLLPSDPACIAEIADPNRTYLGTTQLQWLEDSLLNSTATFKFVMNGPIITGLNFLPYDRWEGYAAERQALLDFIETNGIKNVIFLSTDIHAMILNDSVASTSVRELVGGAIGMDSIFRELPPTVEALLGTLPLLFPSISTFELDRFNVGLATVSSTEASFEFRDGSGQILKTLVIPAIP